MAFMPLVVGGTTPTAHPPSTSIGGANACRVAMGPVNLTPVNRPHFLQKQIAVEAQPFFPAVALRLTATKRGMQRSSVAGRWHLLLLFAHLLLQFLHALDQRLHHLACHRAWNNQGAGGMTAFHQDQRSRTRCAGRRYGTRCS